MSKLVYTLTGTIFSPTYLLILIKLSSRTQAAARVSDIPDGIHQKCLGWQEAIELYTEAYNDGAIKVVPLVGGRYDHGIYFEDSEDVSPLEGGWEELHDCIEELTQAWCVSLFF